VNKDEEIGPLRRLAAGNRYRRPVIDDCLSTRGSRLPQFLPHTTNNSETTRNTREQVPLCFSGISQ
jgi:hypothetical protein